MIISRRIVTETVIFIFNMSLTQTAEQQSILFSIFILNALWRFDMKPNSAKKSNCSYHVSGLHILSITANPWYWINVLTFYESKWANKSKSTAGKSKHWLKPWKNQALVFIIYWSTNWLTSFIMILRCHCRRKYQNNSTVKQTESNIMHMLNNSIRKNCKCHQTKWCTVELWKFSCRSKELCRSFRSNPVRWPRFLHRR